MQWEESNLTRRDFIKLLGAAPAAAAIPDIVPGRRYAKLVDSFRCIGCRRCMSACKRVNNLPPYNIPELLTIDMDGTTFIAVSFRRSKRNAEIGKFVPYQCMHCIKPACAAVCPVTAITKNPATGAVVIDEKKCIGCRYCIQACPFNVPRFDFVNGIARKCHQCYFRIPKLKPACVVACPVEALEFGYRDLMLKVARQRAQLYRGYVMGEREAGGTDVITILPALPEEIGLIVAKQKVITEGLDQLRISSTGFLAGAAIVGILYLFSRKYGEEPTPPIEKAPEIPVEEVTLPEKKEPVEKPETHAEGKDNDKQ